MLACASEVPQQDSVSTIAKYFIYLVPFPVTACWFRGFSLKSTVSYRDDDIPISLKGVWETGVKGFSEVWHSLRWSRKLYLGSWLCANLWVLFSKIKQAALLSLGLLSLKYSKRISSKSFSLPVVSLTVCLTEGSLIVTEVRERELHLVWRKKLSFPFFSQSNRNWF